MLPARDALGALCLYCNFLIAGSFSPVVSSDPHTGDQSNPMKVGTAMLGVSGPPETMPFVCKTSAKGVENQKPEGGEDAGSSGYSL